MDELIKSAGIWNEQFMRVLKEAADGFDTCTRYIAERNQDMQLLVCHWLEILMKQTQWI